jgi:putative acetyltransferase
MLIPEIREDDLTGPEIVRFLRDHLDYMYAVTPPGSVHALDLERLRAPGMTLWSAWAGGELLGCGALKELDPRSGEVKSMRTAPEHRGKGVGSKILEHLIAVALARDYERLLLETGALPEFAPARALYRRYGFEYRGPFADYREDPNSVYMEKRLQEGEVIDRGIRPFDDRS